MLTCLCVCVCARMQWGISMLHVRGKEYVLRRICLMRTVKGQEGTS